MPVQVEKYRFGPYEVHVRTREIYKSGTRLKLRPQLFQVLQVLVERAGEVVPREELQQMLWPGRTFVDFERGLNTSVKELRRVLSDSASQPRYIETLPKLGYRIIVPVEAEPACGAAPSADAGPVETSAPVSRQPLSRLRGVWLYGTLAIVMALALAGWIVIGRPLPHEKFHARAAHQLSGPGTCGNMVAGRPPGGFHVDGRKAGSLGHLRNASGLRSRPSPDHGARRQYQPGVVARWQVDRVHSFRTARGPLFSESSVAPGRAHAHRAHQRNSHGQRFLVAWQ
jgi:DNA-binding winged helix-turn-helix (wHTH) protein